MSEATHESEPEPELEASESAEYQPVRDSTREPEPQSESDYQPLMEPEQQPEPEAAAELPQAMPDWSQHTTLQWASDLTLTPAATAALQAAFVQEETDGDDLISTSTKRLAKMLARQGCDDAGAVARAVMAARDAEQSIAAALTGSGLPKKMPAETLDPDFNLECEICFLLFSSADQRTPRNLPCGHTFCESCLIDIATQSETEDGAGHKTMACPNCRVFAEVPENGVGELMKNYLVDSMADVASRHLA